MAPSLITLLTDFGCEDAYVGAMKGVISSLAPEARIIDITHEIPPQSIRRGGLVWGAAARYFPPGSIHVGVVDPGVGSRRRILAFVARGSVFLAPDNGIIGLVLAPSEVDRVVAVRRSDLWLRPVSRTFHGRDIFAPVAAHLASGVRVEALGPEVRSYRRDELPRPRRERRGSETILRGEVIDIDRFGNVVTNLLPPEGARLLDLTVGGRSIRRLSSSYASVPEGKLLSLVGSTGFVEVAVRQGSAASELRLEAGTPVVSRWG